MCFQPTHAQHKNTWGVINEIILKSAKTKSCPDIFKDGQHGLNDDLEITNRFNAFFTNVGRNQSRNIRYNGILHIVVVFNVQYYSTNV